MISRLRSVCALLALLGSAVALIGDVSAAGPASKVDVTATLVLDAVSARDLFDAPKTLDVRRARVGAEIGFNKNASADITLDLEDGEDEDDPVELHELVLKLDIGQAGRISAGLQKQAFGFERSTSSRQLRTAERSLATQAFAADRAFGLAYRHELDKGLITFGAYTDRGGEGDLNAAGRFVWVPRDTKRSVRHLGLGLHHVVLEDQRHRIRSDSQLNVSPPVARSERFDAERMSTASVEAGWLEGAFSIQGEWFVQQLDVGSESEMPSFDGGYWQLGWVFGGGWRKYSGGRFGGITAGKGKPATEITLGYSLLRTRYDGEGDNAEELTVGVNRQVNSYLRLSAHAFHVRVDQSTTFGIQTGTGSVLRFQVAY